MTVSTISSALKSSLESFRENGKVKHSLVCVRIVQQRKITKQINLFFFKFHKILKLALSLILSHQGLMQPVIETFISSQQNIIVYLFTSSARLYSKRLYHLKKCLTSCGYKVGWNWSPTFFFNIFKWPANWKRLGIADVA